MAELDTLRIINDEVKERLGVQRSAVERIETKATLLVGFSIALGQFVVAQKPHGPLLVWTLVAVGVAVGSGILAILLRRYREVPDPKALADSLHHAQPEAVFTELIANRLNAFSKNAEILEWRAWWWRASLAGLILAAILGAFHLTN